MTQLVPRIPAGGTGRELKMDFPGLRIGVAEYDEGPTGCTVFHFSPGAHCAVDVRGGSPGLLGSYPWTEAICIAGGSLYGLEAATGVSATMLEERGGEVGWGRIATVCSGIIYDFGPRTNSIYPDKALGRAAYQAAQPGVFLQGRHGAGRSATCGKFPDFPHYEREYAGQGAAFGMCGGSRVFVATVVNSIGVVVDRKGRVVRGLRDSKTGERRHPRDILDPAVESAPGPVRPSVTENTTITLVATDHPLPPLLLTQLGRQVHSSMARAIQPFHTPRDGDILFTLSTATSKATVNNWALAEFASDLAWDAVLAAVEER
ncbi:MAG TPA: P1 family peptidase [Ramlibacter sp.]|nr:P1 family peptidase [Ramlibacter sp.]